MNNVLKQFETKPSIARIGGKIIVGIYSLTPELAREFAEDLNRLADEADSFLKEKQQQKREEAVNQLNLFLNLDDEDNPNECRALIVPSSADIRAYGRTIEPAQVHVGTSKRQPIRIKESVLSPKPPAQNKKTISL